MGKLGDIAKKTVGVQAMKIDDIVKKFGGVVTINGLSYTEYKGSRIPVFSFVEGEGLCFWGGCKKLRELAEAWEEVYGDLRAVNDELAVEGVRIRLSEKIATKDSKPFRPVSVIGSVKLDGLDAEPNVNLDTGEIDADPTADPF